MESSKFTSLRRKVNDPNALSFSPENPSPTQDMYIAWISLGYVVAIA
jgi:hypothetical protein